MLRYVEELNKEDDTIIIRSTTNADPSNPALIPLYMHVTGNTVEYDGENCNFHYYFDFRDNKYYREFDYLYEDSNSQRILLKRIRFTRIRNIIKRLTFNIDMKFKDWILIYKRIASGSMHCHSGYIYANEFKLWDLENTYMSPKMIKRHVELHKMI